jgi:group I intron endonuclease
MENKKIHGYIYLITNLINGKQYVGQTVQTIKARFRKHFSDAKYKNTYISRAINKYGRENFKIEQIDIAYNQIELNLLEGVYMLWFKTLAPNGYNLKEIIEGKGKHSEETIQKMKITRNKPKNLKICSENGKKCRGKSRIGSTSKYVGVVKYKNKYRAIISYSMKTIHLGLYDIETDAAKAYDIKALELFGYDCVLNFTQLRQDYIDNKIIINKSNILRNRKSKSGEKDIHFEKSENKWRFRWFDKNLNKNRSKNFRKLEDAIIFKNLINS